MYIHTYRGEPHCRRGRGQVEVWYSWGTGGKDEQCTVGPTTWHHEIYSGTNTIMHKNCSVSPIVFILTPPVSPNTLSRSGGVNTSLPTTSCLNPGQYSSILLNTIHMQAHQCHWIYMNKVISIYVYTSHCMCQLIT